MSSEITVLNEIVQEQRAQIAELVSKAEDLLRQFDIVLAERNEAMDENASARSVHQTLVRNLTSMSEFAGKAMNERDEARAEVEKLREQVARAEEERRHAVAALSEQVDTARAERDEVRQSYCSLMEAYRGGDGRVTANKLGWGYLFEEDKPCQ